MPQKLTQVQHVQKRYMLQLRCETREKCSVWLANHALVLSDVPHRNPRAYDGREEQTAAEGIADVRRGTPASD